MGLLGALPVVNVGVTSATADRSVASHANPVLPSLASSLDTCASPASLVAASGDELDALSLVEQAATNEIPDTRKATRGERRRMAEC